MSVGAQEVSVGAQEVSAGAREVYSCMKKNYLIVILITVLVGVPIVPVTVPAGADDHGITSLVEQELATTVELYKWLHAHPERPGEEENTAQRLAEELEKLNIEIHTGVGGHGIVALLVGGESAKELDKPEKPVTLYRADMDALPMQEDTGLPYASENPGLMHSCGHDIHMAAAIGTARILHRLRSTWKGTIILVLQPAEEIGAGARKILADETFTEVLNKAGSPDLALALHDTPELPAGQMSVTPGWVNANCNSVNITIFGKGGHGARPHESVDPIVIGAETVLALQTIVSRRLPPGTKAVVTVGKFTAGTKRNIIPATAELQLTVRSYTDEVREKLLQEIERTAVNVARAHGAPSDPEVKIYERYTPAGYNDPEWVERLSRWITAELGEGCIKQRPPSMGGEDFSRYSRTLGSGGVRSRNLYNHEEIGPTGSSLTDVGAGPGADLPGSPAGNDGHPSAYPSWQRPGSQ